GYGVVRALAPGRAGARRVPRPLGVRGRLRLRCTHRCRYRLHHRTAGRGARRGAGSLACSSRSGPPVPGRSRSPPGPSRNCASGSRRARPASPWAGTASCSSATTPTASRSGGTGGGRGRRRSDERQAMLAQAVVSRTFALKNRGRWEGQGLDAWADVRDQVYAGVAGETGEVWDALRATRGEVIWYGGALI